MTSNQCSGALPRTSHDLRWKIREENMKRLLIVDDSDAARTALTRLFSERQWDCVSVASGAEAVIAIKREEFDVALVDCWMPGLSGFDMLDKAVAVTPNTPVVMMSAMGTAATEKEARKNGAAGFVDKAAGLMEIEVAVDRALALRRDIMRRLETVGPSAGESKGTILLADDHDGFRTALALLLKRAGFRVRDVSTGTAAVAAWREGGFDAALVDIHMPDVNGIVVAQTIRQFDPDAAIALMSGEASASEKTEGLPYAVMGCLDKNFGFERIKPFALFLVREARRMRENAVHAMKWRNAPLSKKAVVYFRRFKKSAIRSMASREAGIYARGMVAAVMISLVFMGAFSKYELMKIERESIAQRSSMSISQMYDKVAGYLERDEQRELDRR